MSKYKVRYRIYNWLKKQSGNVTIEELIAQFPNATPIEIAEGFNMFVNEQIEGR